MIISIGETLKDKIKPSPEDLGENISLPLIGKAASIALDYAYRLPEFKIPSSFIHYQYIPRKSIYLDPKVSIGYLDQDMMHLEELLHSRKPEPQDFIRFGHILTVIGATLAQE